MTAKTDATKAGKRAQIDEHRAELEQLKSTTPEVALAALTKELSLPGYMLLIDEPEVGLHPGAVRAASRHLYGLAQDPAWQVMVGTHSPVFIDPLHDHTTIVRLDRSEANPTPRTFRADTVGFTDDQKMNLKMLNRFDEALSEMFFGQYPVLIEGDTEFSAFEAVMNLDPQAFSVQRRPVLVRARGKPTMELIIRMLTHFHVPFSVLHDADCPRLRNGDTNTAWTANAGIYARVKEAREMGVPVIHRLSVPVFELAHLPLQLDDDGRVKQPPAKDKPWRMHQAILTSETVAASVRSVLDDLLTGDAAPRPFEGPFDTCLASAVEAWGKSNAPLDPRFTLDDPQES